MLAGHVSVAWFLFQALCPLRDVPSHSSHGDPLSYYQIGDLIQGKCTGCSLWVPSSWPPLLSTHLMGGGLRFKSSNVCGVFFCILIAAIKDIDRYHEKLAVSLHISALSPSLASTKLGVINSEDLPLHYRYGIINIYCILF